MSSPWRPVDGEEIVVTPATVTPGGDSEAVPQGAPHHAVADDEDPYGSDAVIRDRGRRFDNRLLLASAILVAVLAQLVVGFLALSSINDLRNQTASANGLQRCLITAQLKQVSTSNAATYQTDVKACISK